MPKRISTSAYSKKLRKANAYLHEVRAFRESIEKPNCYLGLKTLVGLLCAGAYGYTTYDTALAAVSKLYNLPSNSVNSIALAIYLDFGSMIFSAKNATEFFFFISTSFTNTFRRIKTHGLSQDELLSLGRKEIEHDQSLSGTTLACVLPIVIGALSAGFMLQKENGADLSMLIMFIFVQLSTNTLSTARLPKTFMEAMAIFGKNRSLSQLETLVKDKLYDLSEKQIQDLLDTFNLITQSTAPLVYDIENIDVTMEEIINEKSLVRRAIAEELKLPLDEIDQPKTPTTDGNLIYLKEGAPVKENLKGEVLSALPCEQEIIEFAGVLQQFDNITEVFQKIHQMMKLLKIDSADLIKAFQPESKGWHGFKVGMTVFSTTVGITSVAPAAFTVGLLREALEKTFSSLMGETIGKPLGTGLGIALPSLSATVNFLVHIRAFILSTKIAVDFIQHPIKSVVSLIKSPIKLLSLTIAAAIAYGGFALHYFTTEENNPIKNRPAATMIDMASALSFAINAAIATYSLSHTCLRWCWRSIKNCYNKAIKTTQEQGAKQCSEVFEDAVAIQRAISASSMHHILMSLPSVNSVCRVEEITDDAPLLTNNYRAVEYGSSFDTDHPTREDFSVRASELTAPSL